MVAWHCEGLINCDRQCNYLLVLTRTTFPLSTICLSMLWEKEPRPKASWNISARNLWVALVLAEMFLQDLEQPTNFCPCYGWYPVIGYLCLYKCNMWIFGGIHDWHNKECPLIEKDSEVTVGCPSHCTQLHPRFHFPGVFFFGSFALLASKKTIKPPLFGSKFIFNSPLFTSNLVSSLEKDPHSDGWYSMTWVIGI